MRNPFLSPKIFLPIYVRFSRGRSLIVIMIAVRILYRIFLPGGRKLDWGDSSDRGTVFIYIYIYIYIDV